LARLELRDVRKVYANGIVAARGVDLAVEEGERFVIVGPSGSGKSTLLRLVAGLESLDAGSIWLDGERVDQRDPRDRGLALVFQDPMLYPHLNVFENLAFGLRARRTARTEVEQRVGEAAAMLGVQDLLERAPATLSGGQKRRVALGRAIAVRPRLLLLDEPFSGLDTPLRASTRAELIDLQRRLGITMLLVTHDQAEALAVGDRVAVFDRGEVAQVGAPLEVHDRPAHRFVAAFLGQPPMNLARCAVVATERGSVMILDAIDAGPWRIPARLPAGRFEVGFRPEHLTILSPEEPLQVPVLPAKVTRVEPLGHETIVAIAAGGLVWNARMPARTSVRVGDSVNVRFDLADASWFDAASGRRIEPTPLADLAGPSPE
jgi:ABC-type sugar transport system ATPase subunit